MQIRTLIIDDEYLARERLKKMLLPFNDIIISGECRNGDEALEMIALKSPDLIFLDIQMPGKNGFEVLIKLQKTNVQIPLVVFTTAFDEYAIKAFEARALDYLLKPFDPTRFNDAVYRIREHLKLKQSFHLNKQMQDLLKGFNTEIDTYTHIIEIKEKGMIYKVHVTDIIYIRAEGNYLNLHTFDKKWLYRATLEEMYNKLDSKKFLKIHRSQVINLDYISAHKYMGNNEFSFLMKNGESLRSSRSFKASISEMFS